MPIADVREVAAGFVPQALFLDLDGTCLDHEQKLHPQSLEAIQNVSTRIPVVIATGRMYRSALPWCERMRLDTPVICYQGALVCDSPSHGGAVLLSDNLAPEPVVAAVELLRENGWHRQAFVDDNLWCEEDRPEAHIYARIADVPINFVDDLLTKVGSGATKVVSVSADTELISRIEVALCEKLGGNARVTTSLPQMVEVVSPQVGKGRAAERVCEHLGVEMACAVAVGDAPNDADLLEAAGFAVAVRPVHPRLADIANATCSAPDQGGVAEVIAAFNLKSGCELRHP